MWNMERIGFTASEEKSFENVDGRTTDGRRMPAFGSDELKICILNDNVMRYLMH